MGGDPSGTISLKKKFEKALDKHQIDKKIKWDLASFGSQQLFPLNNLEKPLRLQRCRASVYLGLEKAMAMSVVGEATTTEHFSLDARELFTTHRGRAILCAILFLVTLIIASPFITPFLFDKQDLINLVESKVFPVENSGPLALVEFVPVAALLSYGSAILGLRVTGANCKSRRMITALTVARWLVAGLMFESAYLHALTRFLAAIATVANVTAGAAGGSEESDAISSLIVYLLLYGAPVFLTSISAAVVWECQKPSSRFKIVRITKGRPIAGVISLIVMLPIAPVLIGIVSLAATSLIILVVAMVFTLILYLIAFAASARSDYRDM